MVARDGPNGMHRYCPLHPCERRRIDERGVGTEARLGPPYDWPHPGPPGTVLIGDSLYRNPISHVETTGSPMVVVGTLMLLMACCLLCTWCLDGASTLFVPALPSPLVPMQSQRPPWPSSHAGQKSRSRRSDGGCQSQPSDGPRRRFRRDGRGGGGGGGGGRYNLMAVPLSFLSSSLPPTSPRRPYVLSPPSDGCLNVCRLWFASFR